MFTANTPHPTPLIPGMPNAPPHPPPHLPAQPVSRMQERQVLRTARRSTRAHNPVHGQGVRSHEGGRGQGRTRGSANYCPQEIEILLDLVEAELPVGAKGWSVVGARFREWAAVAEYPSQTDRSLEAKYKQV